ncbi:hypothetical protein [Paenibacillus radicis (ex Gao et al. 2016)]|uniref:Uncharacterized protein n=1 Tax=Paenibacillus radicis (ex Gao et al. 2016) TaxID=1737354 RepID=A0A917LU95_9BACL|nr:hypothetical protein [Paenibacillus radicis (ex Gao et al. 2016)]GGG56966.1 hypothetical protein GCM10010918_07510 [Paenibacillus radicis (ex Gao et al. 2016)]
MKNIVLIGCLLGAIVSQIPASASMPPLQASKGESYPLLSVNGLTLDDDPATVEEKLGKPLNVTQDEWLAELQIYDYTGMDIAFRDGWLDYVEIAGDAEQLRIDGNELPATETAIREALGEPDFIAEDGIVFQRNEALLKLFIDPDTGKLKSIAYYHIASV